MIGIFFRKKFKIKGLVKNFSHLYCILYISQWSFFIPTLLLYYSTDQEADEKEKSKEASDKC